METGTDETLDTLPTDSRDGNYRFDGWFTDPTGGVQIVMLNEARTELALTQRNENTYTFIMPDGRGSIDAYFV